LLQHRGSVGLCGYVIEKDGKIYFQGPATTLTFPGKTVIGEGAGPPSDGRLEYISIVKSIDRAGFNRSAFLERASRAYLAHLERVKRDAKDAEILNRHADRLNEEGQDVLEYQDVP